MAENDISPDSFAVDTGMVLALYGLRPPGDIDIVSDAPMPAGPVERHAAEWREVSPSELVQDPSRHFNFAGLRFASLREVAALKAKRLAGRDREDLLLMAPLLEAEASPPGPPGMGLKLRMTGLRVRRALIRLLMRLGIGRPLRRLYRLIRGRPVA